MESWEAALDKFLGEWRGRKEVVGALVCGSFVTGSPTAHSDIDVYIILADGTAWRERGDVRVDGFLIEYFANPPSQIRAYFEGEYPANSRITATLVATGRVLFDKTGTIAEIRREARRWIRKPFAKPGKLAIESAKYGLWDNLDDLQDTYERRVPDFAYRYHQLLRQAYAAYAKFLRQPVVGVSKQYKCLHEPEKARGNYRMPPFPDEEFLSLFDKAMMETDAARMLERAEKLTRYVLAKMGGFEINGWELRTPAKT